MDLFIPSSSSIFIILADFLDPCDLAALSQTARKFRDACGVEYVFHPNDDGWDGDARDFSQFYNAKSISYQGASMEDDDKYTFLKLKSLTKITINDGKLHSLKGFETLTNLRILDLDTNEFADLSPIANLRDLKVLNISCNDISDISPLKNLCNLVELDLSANDIKDLSPLENLINLQKLDFSCSEDDLYLLRNLVNMRKLRILCHSDSDLDYLTGMHNLEILKLTSSKLCKNMHLLDNFRKLRKYEITEYFCTKDEKIIKTRPSRRNPIGDVNEN